MFLHKYKLAMVHDEYDGPFYRWLATWDEQSTILLLSLLRNKLWDKAKHLDNICSQLGHQTENHPSEFVDTMKAAYAAPVMKKEDHSEDNEAW